MTAVENGELEFSCYTEPGRQRDRNEDACAVPPSSAETTKKGTLLVLADGVGGYPGGAEASQQAVQIMQALYYAEVGSQYLPERLRATVESVNGLARLHQRKTGQELGYLTTLVAAVILQDEIWIANVGDSRAYLVQAASKKRRQLTEDHSGHVRMVKAGLASESETERTSSTITRAIGLEDDCQVDTYHYAWHPGDCLVLCSDGLASLPEKEMIEIILQSTAAPAARQLVARAIELDGSDNCTVVVAKWLPHSLTSKRKAAPRSKSASLTLPGLPPPARSSRRTSWRWILLWVMVGVLLGLLVAAVYASIWMNASGLLPLFN